MKMILLAATISMMSVGVSVAEIGGEAIFKANCAACHPNGGNIMKPKKALKNIKEPKKIIKQLRDGGGGMPSFDAKSISDADARLLADYIIKTFKK